MKSSHGRREGFWWPHSDEDLYNLPMPHEVDDIFSVLELAGTVLPSSLLQGAAWQGRMPVSHDEAGVRLRC